jgi:hypothetical protein
VGDETLSIGVDCYDGPILQFRDRTGKLAPLSRRADNPITQIPHYGLSGSTVLWKLPPGFGHGYAISIGDYYDLSFSGTYTALATKCVADGSLLVATTSLRGDGSPVPPETRGEAGQRAPVPPTGRQWARAVPGAAKSHVMCCLDVFPCVAKKGGPKVVASLLCLEEPIGYLDLPGADAADYKVLVYDASGKPVPRLQPAAPPSGKLTRTGAGGTLIGIGTAIGAVIPLADWFDMKKPGKYSVLVSLPQSGKDDPAWVAQPITVTVPK